MKKMEGIKTDYKYTKYGYIHMFRDTGTYIHITHIELCNIYLVL